MSFFKLLITVFVIYLICVPFHLTITSIFQSMKLFVFYLPFIMIGHFIWKLKRKKVKR